MGESSPVLDRILSADCCTGCGLCQAMSGGQKIEMRLTGPGFLRPVQIAPLSPEDDALLETSCPGIHLDLQTMGIDNHPIWGPVHVVRTGAATDKALRHEASSGGVLSALLCYLLDEKKVGYAVHTAVSQSSPIINETVETRSSQDIPGTSGSRYSPSAPLRNFDGYLSRSEPFALLGKPCDIAAARAFGRHDPRVKETVPYMLSFYCAGVPNLDGTRKILSELGVEEENLTRFRYRGDGWPGYAVAQTRDGQSARMSYADSWGGILSHHTQFRCKICPDGTGGFADVVCGDAWYSDDQGYPKFDEEEGRSLIISRTIRGEKLVQAAIKAGYIEVESLDIGEIQKMQPSQANRKRLVTSRLLAMRLISGFRPSYTGLNLRQAAASAPLRLRIRNFLGMARRMVLRKKR